MARCSYRYMLHQCKTYIFLHHRHIVYYGCPKQKSENFRQSFPPDTLLEVELYHSNMTVHPHKLKFGYSRNSFFQRVFYLSIILVCPDIRLFQMSYVSIYHIRRFPVEELFPESLRHCPLT